MKFFGLGTVPKYSKFPHPEAKHKQTIAGTE